MNPNPNDWSCLPTAFANVVGIPVSHLINKIGHDGSDQPEEWGGHRRGFHTQECIEYLDSLGWNVICIDLYPRMYPAPGLPPILCDLGDPKDRLKSHMELDIGVICGILNREGKEIGHAVSWIDGMIHDPRGSGALHLPESFLYRDYKPQLFFKVRG